MLAFWLKAHSSLIWTSVLGTLIVGSTCVPCQANEYWPVGSIVIWWIIHDTRNGIVHLIIKKYLWHLYRTIFLFKKYKLVAFLGLSTTNQPSDNQQQSWVPGWSRLPELSTSSNRLQHLQLPGAPIFLRLTHLPFLSLRHQQSNYEKPEGQLSFGGGALTGCSASSFHFGIVESSRFAKLTPSC